MYFGIATWYLCEEGGSCFIIISQRTIMILWFLFLFTNVMVSFNFLILCRQFMLSTLCTWSFIEKNLNPLPSKNVLWQVWLKLIQWVWKTGRFKAVYMYCAKFGWILHQFTLIIEIRVVVHMYFDLPLIVHIWNSLLQRMLCVKFG